MENLIIELYRFTVANNILDSLIRNFRRNLAIFKLKYRTTYKLIRIRDSNRI
jgi:hypothetical protein